MPEPKAFIDTNVLIYLLKDDAEKADRAEDMHNGQLIDRQLRICNPFVPDRS